MKKLQLKRIIGGFILIFVIMFGFFSIRGVLAEEVSPIIEPKDKDSEVNLPACKDYLDNLQTINRYGMTVSSGDVSGTYVVKIKPESELNSSLRSKLGKVKFNVTVNGAPVGTVFYGSPLTITGSFVDSDGMKEMKINLVSTEESSDPNCSGKVEMEYAIENGGEPFTIDEGVRWHDPGDGSSSYTIDCDNPKDDDFELKFCEAKNKVVKDPDYKKESKELIDFTGKFDNDGSFTKVVGSNKFSKFECNHTTIHTPVDLKKNYYVNRDYLYGSGTRTINGGHYTYEYSPGDSKTDGEAICKVKCEEAVIVEYGPPIASKAGLCFEYKIKVTSRVSCNMTEKPTPPEVPSGYCTPTPWCTNARGSYMVNQGGPNEEFDDCIQSCDGGKYTDKCSKKCYKKVYGNSSDNKISNTNRGYSIEKLNAPNEAIKNCANSSEYGGCYYKEGSKIKWYGRSCTDVDFDSNTCSRNTAKPEDDDVFVPGRWYRLSWVKGNKIEYFVPWDDGFKRHFYAKNNFCHDRCVWKGCGEDDVYINPGYAAKDMDKNKKIYESAIAQCTAAASCNTSTAEFTIAVDYTHDTKDVKDKKVTITFPYSTGADKLTSKGDGAENPVNTADNSNSTILSYNGCYDSGEKKDWYKTEWSFPGSWINNKTGEVSYKKKADGGAWKEMKDKFCIPLDAEDVNRSWWNYYYSNPNILNLEHTAIKSDAYKDKCDANYPSSVSSASVDEWNITGKAVKFGYFDWNLEFKCFYALNTNPSNIEKDECKESNYRIRSVDLNNMFPATDGKLLPSNEQFGRTPGFNWTAYADNDKNPSYLSYPSKYMEQVQKTGYGIYSDNYLDYEFELTPEILRKMRQTTKKNEANYTEFSGTSTIGENGVVHYTSKAIRDGAVLNVAKNKVPEGSGRLCNNMVNYASNQCMSYDAG